MCFCTLLPPLSAIRFVLISFPNLNTDSLNLNVYSDTANALANNDIFALCAIVSDRVNEVQHFIYLQLITYYMKRSKRRLQMSHGPLYKRKNTNKNNKKAPNWNVW